jgi:hypothetical protein
MSEHDEDEKVPQPQLPALLPQTPEPSAAEAEFIDLFEPRPSWWSRLKVIGAGVFAVALYLGIAFDFLGFVFSSRDIAARPQKPAVLGWNDLETCAFLTSLDDKKNLTLTEDQGAELMEAAPDENDAPTESKKLQGRWGYDAGSKRYSITLNGDTATYTLISRGEPATCILVKGDLDTADLRASWFSFPSNDDVLDYDYEPDRH